MSSPARYQLIDPNLITRTRMPSYTSTEEFEVAYSTLFNTFKTGITKNLSWRKWQLKQCWWMIADNEAEILSALHEDLGRNDYESHSTDLLALKGDILDAIKNVEKWAKPSKPDAGFLFGTLGKARIRHEPLGVALIIGAWNFPFHLLLSPMVAAISAGCCVMMKPSEMTVACQDLIVKLVPKYLDPSTIRIATGGPGETAKILEHKFNHIFFTGSSKVARYITAAAAKNLTPTVLELGGQGPAVVTASANVDLAAKRIALGKFQNAGQICLSINHVFVDPSIHDKFVARLGFWFDTYLKGEKSSSEQMTKIVNESNYDRLVSLLEKSEGQITYGGKRDRNQKFMAPTVVTGVTLRDSLLSDELFGPILPIIKANHREACKAISSMDHPLAIYIFSAKQGVIDEILNNTNSGGVTINDYLMHAGVPNAPFGGVGESGYGSYHGIYGFLAFSHQRTVVAIPTWMDKAMGFRYPPYNTGNLKKVLVKNNLGFKRGEGLQDQKVGKNGVVWKLFLPLTVLIGLLSRLLAGRKASKL